MCLHRHGVRVGWHLANWLGEEPRSIPEILDVWGQAARGLIAAHASGLVHRDFKPDNVLIGESGRVRVGEFGLVTSIGAEVEEISKRPDTPLTVSITMDGSILGTPAYMAPEQHEGLATDARTDQFSFLRLALRSAVRAASLRRQHVPGLGRGCLDRDGEGSTAGHRCSYVSASNLAARYVDTPKGSL
ncbi:MAG: protein kinase [Myxococcales bacterium]|nr:protein kinase [Myxococcales bacterium]